MNVRYLAGVTLRYVWALRVPAVSAAVLVGLPTLGFLRPFRSYVSGVFDPVQPAALTPIAALALFDAGAIVIIAGLILTYGADRFGLPAIPLTVASTRWSPWAAVALLLASPVIVRTITYADVLHGWAWIVPLLAGLGVVAVLVLASIWISQRSRVVRRHSAYSRFLGLLTRFPLVSAGFLETRADGTTGLRPGHGLAFGLCVSSIALYVGTGFATSSISRPALASALAFVLLLVLMLTWLTGFAVFLFDRIRIPLVLLFTTWVLIVTYCIDPVFPTDHIYRTASLENATPPAGLSQLFAGTGTPIVVAASGGGIQAAAWTARVMTALDGISGFRSNVRLVSAVSGGSLATMNLLASWPGCGASAAGTVPASVVDVNVASRESSLHAVGWGLVFKDLPRSVLPFFSNPYVDRGSVLEDAWKQELLELQPSPLLASWRTRAAEHGCPGVVFNAMVAETGEPMLFSTVELPATLAPFSFYRHYPDRDVPITTAVRLSAAFPYVSAAARADGDSATGHYRHLVDGGYFDNYGVGTMAAISDAALAAQPSPRGQRLLVLEVCDAAKCAGEPPNPPSAPQEPGGVRGAWPYQIVAPLQAIIAMRSSAQRVTDRTTLALLQQKWRAKLTCVETVQVPYGSDEAPMSWHLTPAEKKAVDSTWLGQNASRHIMADVAEYLKGNPITPEGKACMNEVAAAGQAR